MTRNLLGFHIRQVVVGVSLFLLAIDVQVAAFGAEVTFTKKPGEVDVRIGGEDVATYAYADRTIPRPYFAHVHGPGGVQLTRNHPPVEAQDRTDHATMHPGIWMAFGDLNGTDIWRNKGRVVHERFVQETDRGFQPWLVRREKPL
jgi:hypothetical protein